MDGDVIYLSRHRSFDVVEVLVKQESEGCASRRWVTTRLVGSESSVGLFYVRSHVRRTKVGRVQGDITVRRRRKDWSSTLTTVNLHRRRFLETREILRSCRNIGGRMITRYFSDA
jgi:hypothetical protein